MTTRHEYRTRDEAAFAVIADDPRAIAHEIVYWLPSRLTMEQWIALDDAFEAALASVLDDTDGVRGVAGPIPLSGEADE